MTLITLVQRYDKPSDQHDFQLQIKAAIVEPRAEYVIFLMRHYYPIARLFEYVLKFHNQSYRHLTNTIQFQYLGVPLLYDLKDHIKPLFGMHLDMVILCYGPI